MAQRIQIHASDGSQIIVLNSPLRQFVEGQVGLHQRKFTLVVLLVSNAFSGIYYLKAGICEREGRREE